MELIKKRIHYVREGKKIFDQFYVDEEYNVPEAKEDVRRIVDTGTELKIEEIRPVENYVRITGKLYFRILYLNVSSDPKPGVLCAGGYYLYESLITGNWAAPLAGIPGYLIQVLLSAVFYIIAGNSFDRMHLKEKILKNG